MLGLARSWTAFAALTKREPFYPANLAKFVFLDWNVSSAKAVAELGFRPTSFEDGARATVEWYREIGMARYHCYQEAVYAQNSYSRRNAAARSEC